MSRAARENRAHKRDWARPGGRHDWLVGALKWILPIAGLLLLAFLFISPFRDRGDVSFILDKKDVAQAEERMRVEEARYVGENGDGEKFEIRAGQAIQQTSAVAVVAIRDMRGTLQTERGPLSVTAERATYDIDEKRIDVIGPVAVRGDNGYRLDASDVTIDLETQRLSSSSPLDGALDLGSFNAQGLVADLGARTAALEGRARLQIRQGAIR